jgi:GntR family transcriptional regulator, transcriptional repressor for pyruvate dehydrogenase complex
MYTRIAQRTPLYTAIVEDISRMLLAGELQPGDMLPPERDLCTRYNVSRTAVREALKVLVDKRMVSILQGRGATVAHPSSETVTESLGTLLKLGKVTPLQLAEVRRGLEPEMAALAAARGTERQLKTIEEWFGRLQSARSSLDEMAGFDIRFHLAIAEAAQNEVAKAMLTSIQALFHDTVSSGYRVEGGVDRTLLYHGHILKALKERDPEAARRWMREHLDDLCQGLASGRREPGTVHGSHATKTDPKQRRKAR